MNNRFIKVYILKTNVNVRKFTAKLRRLFSVT